MSISAAGLLGPNLVNLFLTVYWVKGEGERGGKERERRNPDQTTFHLIPSSFNIKYSKVNTIVSLRTFSHLRDHTHNLQNRWLSNPDFRDPTSCRDTGHTAAAACTHSELQDNSGGNFENFIS